METGSVTYVHSVSEAGRLLPSASRWNSIEIDFSLFPQSHSLEFTHSNYYKSVESNLKITNKQCFKRFILALVSLVFIFLLIFLLLKFLPNKHGDQSSSNNFTLALNRALIFFDAQKSGFLPANNSVKFRGDSGLSDGKSGSNSIHDLIGGFYDSGNNIKFGFPMAYTITLLSWSVLEYHQKYEAIGELDHVKNIIRWGSDYLLKVYVPPNSSTDPGILYSQVGSTSITDDKDDINCWQRPEDMNYARPVSMCKSFASDLAGETVAALSASSLVFKQDKPYAEKLTKLAEKLFVFATNDQDKGTYTSVVACGGEARNFYNSSGYMDELVWGGTWLFFATGNITYLDYATKQFASAMDAELTTDRGVFDWNNKLAANAVLFTRLRYLHDPGYPYEDTLKSCSNITDILMCSYLSIQNNFNTTPGGLILLRPNSSAPLQFAATAAFLSKLYSDYLDSLKTLGGTCGTHTFSLDKLLTFSTTQVEYILGNNPLKMSYLVGFGDHFPTQVHHRAASIPLDGQHYSCQGGKRWLYSKDPNPNILVGAMVGGPDQYDKFSDKRDEALYTEPTISGNAGLVAALIALHDSPTTNGGIDQIGFFTNIHI
ncbi:endoglucanase 25-like [Tasmannia lanceolata]|uniref:endoglucanase 25-like n=1 Tax=Tasmannia lanceolata TaxID=3420 RepID=UPI004062EFCC